MNKIDKNGQTLLELVIGLALITAIITALAITTTYGLRNTQFSKNQALATQMAQENLEKVRTVKSANYGVCIKDQTPCLTWEDIWSVEFGTFDNCLSAGCTYVASVNCTIAGDEIVPICLSFDPGLADLGNGFTGQLIIEDEAGASGTQKRVTSKVYWTDTTGKHSSDLVTVFTKQ